MKENDQSSLDSAKLAIHATKKVFRKMKQAKPNDLDQKFHKGHEAEFKKMDCLSCANCCKTTSPIFRDADIRRISKHLRVKEGKFISDYLRMDEEEDYVLKSSPCSFLEKDNSCSIYDVRPLACREYPHTDRKNMFQVLEITAENSLICPAVARIVLAITSPKI
ncbi:MAG: YkgJ family cysteine cluster protein [Flavobacteriales bacterium]|jgi:Fe-S-cluster containining protein|nr:YkgJ family cysteine cluster protein [Crocinitomicaceae bacterium]NBW29647.1 YkgJ family cysteine cluster protein [Flavobacteriales bacterium]